MDQVSRGAEEKEIREQESRRKGEQETVEQKERRAGNRRAGVLNLMSREKSTQPV